MTHVLAGALAVIVIVLPNATDPGSNDQPGSPAPPDNQPPAASAVAPWPAPGGAVSPVRLDGWKLTLPVVGEKGTAATVDPVNGAPPWLVRNPDGSLTFWAPVDGATTPNSRHARTELVSLRNFSAGQGAHTLRASVLVSQLPARNQDVIIGQIHGAQALSSVPFVMLHYAAGAIYVVVKQAREGSASANYPLLSGVPRSGRFDYAISDRGDGSLLFTAAYGSTSRTATAPIPPPFRNATVRFQAGDYQQAEATGSGQPSGDGARVTFFALDETHDQGPARP